jgi:hypothetical protein
MSIAAIARDHCLAPECVDAPVEGGHYRCLFEDLGHPGPRAGLVPR